MHYKENVCKTFNSERFWHSYTCIDGFSEIGGHGWLPWKHMKSCTQSYPNVQWPLLLYIFTQQLFMIFELKSHSRFFVARSIRIRDNMYELCVKIERKWGCFGVVSWLEQENKTRKIRNTLGLLVCLVGCFRESRPTTNLKK